MPDTTVTSYLSSYVGTSEEMVITSQQAPTDDSETFTPHVFAEYSYYATINLRCITVVVRVSQSPSLAALNHDPGPQANEACTLGVYCSF